MNSRVREFFAGLIPATAGVMEFAAMQYKVKPPGALFYERYDPKFTPYLNRAAALCSFYSGTRQIVFVKPVKIGGTVGLIFPVMLYNIMIAKRNQYYVSADQQLLDEYIEVTFRPHFEASGCGDLIGLANPENDKKKNKKTGQTAQLWQFKTGTYLKFCGANNPNNFRQHEADFVVLDERAAYPTFKSEGNAADLARGRMAANKRSCALVVSSPTEAGTDYHLDYLAGTREKWLSPCPICGELQEMVFGEMGNNNGERELLYGLDFKHKNYEIKSQVHYKCRFCQKYWPEKEKFDVNLRSNWFALRPEFRALSDFELEEKMKTARYEDYYQTPGAERYISMQIEDTLCPFKNWRDTADAFLRAKRKGRPQDLQFFNNAYRGKFWEYQRRSRVKVETDLHTGDYFLREVPKDVAFLTAWADVQGHYLDLGVYGWGANHENWVIDRIQIEGEPSKAKCWQELERIITTMRWGGMFPPFFGIDEGGEFGWDQIVLQFARRINREESERAGNSVIVVIPTKGAASTSKRDGPYRVSKAKIGNHGMGRSDNLMHILTNTYHYKSQILGDESTRGWLDGEIGKDGEKPYGFCNFPKDYRQNWWKQLRSEEKIIEITPDGYEKPKWQKKRTRNESLDIFVGCAMLADYFVDTQIMPNLQGVNDWDAACKHMIKLRGNPKEEESGG